MWSYHLIVIFALNLRLTTIVIVGRTQNQLLYRFTGERADQKVNRGVSAYEVHGARPKNRLPYQIWPLLNVFPKREFGAFLLPELKTSYILTY